MFRSFYRIFAVFMVLSLALAACTTPTATPTAVVEPTMVPTTAPAEPTAVPQETGGLELPVVDPTALSGKIYAAGSSTVYPLAEAIAEQFRNDGYAGELKIDSVGTGGGMERFCTTAESDIANASRKIKDGEKEACVANNRTPIQFLVGLDAMAVVINKDNDFVKDLSKADLAKIFSDQSVKWSDINPDWPAEEIQRFAPGTDSGTFDFFIETVMGPAYEKDLDKAEEAFLKAANLETSEDDNVLVQGVAGNKYAIGFFGYAYYPENADKLGIISVEGIMPSLETAEDGSYPLARPLFIYSDAEIMKSKPEVAGFINYFLTFVNDYIQEVGYFPASQQALDAAKQAYLDALNAPAEPTAVPQETGGLELPVVDPTALSGKIYAAGSSTVYPLAEAIAEQFRNDGYAGELKIDSVGTGGGMERFCTTAESDIANASRKIKDGEKEACVANNRTPIQFLVGLDAMAVVINKDNDFVKDLSKADLAKIFSDQSVKWSDVNPDWPAEEIQRFAPGTDSGTFDFFIETVMGPAYEKDLDKAEEAFLKAANLETSEDDNVLVQGVAGNKYAIGFFGYAYYPENADKLGIISVEGIMPSLETAEDGSYPLARPLFIYSDAEIMKSKPEVAGFINYFLTFVNDYIQEVGYFPASQQALDAARQAYLDALK